MSYSTGRLVLSLCLGFQADVDGDGTIHYIEFISATKEQRRKKKKKEVAVIPIETKNFERDRDGGRTSS